MNTKYKKYEFCTSKGCIGVQLFKGKLDCPVLPEECLFTAKEFHHWLDANGIEIVKKEIGMKKWNEDGEGCLSCYWRNNDQSCKSALKDELKAHYCLPYSNFGKSYYANKAQVEAMLQWCMEVPE